MNDEMKKLISRFLFVSVLICCLGLLASGSITASQKSAKNTFDKAYAVMNMKNSGGKLEINIGEEKYDFNFNLAEKIKKYEDYIMLTPVASVYYFALSAVKMGEGIRNQRTE